MRILVLTATYESCVSRKSHLRDHPMLASLLFLASTLLLVSMLFPIVNLAHNVKQRKSLDVCNFINIIH